MSTLSLRLSPELDAQLNEESRLSAQPKSLLARSALEQFLAARRRDRFLARLATAAAAIDAEFAAALAAEALPLDNESLALVERGESAADRSTVGRGP